MFLLQVFASIMKTTSVDFGIASSSSFTNFPSGTAVPFTKLHLKQFGIYVTSGHGFNKNSSLALPNYAKRFFLLLNNRNAISKRRNNDL